MNEVICVALKALTLCSVLISVPAGGHQQAALPQGNQKVCVRGYRVERVETPAGVIAQEHRNECTAAVGFYNPTAEPVEGAAIVALTRGGWL